MCDITKSIFSSKNLRCTKQREVVYEYLANTKTHPTADELFQSILDSNNHKVSRATVYNALDALVCAGLCRKITPEAGPTRYDADISAHNHIITDDGRVLDIPEHLAQSLPQHLPPHIINAIENQLNIKINRVAITLHAQDACTHATRNP